MKKERNRKGRWQAFWKGLQVNANLYASFFLSLVGIGSLVANAIEKKDIAVALLVSIVSIVFSVVSLLTQIIRYKKEQSLIYAVEDQHYKDKLQEKIKANISLLDGGYAYQSFGQQAYIVSEEVDRYLQKNATAIALLPSESQYRLPQELNTFIPFALRKRLDSGRKFYNSKKIRLCDDLTPKTMAVHLQKTDYFSVFCSNDLSYRKLRSRKSLSNRFNGGDILLDDNDCLSTLEDSVMANNIGVSTLAITTDGYAIVSLQGDLNNVGAGRFAPSGSGSQDYADAKNCKNLAAVLINGMNRELREECHLPREALLRTEVVGYIRIVERGGKPDFFGLTRIPYTKEQVESWIPHNPEIRQGLMQKPSFILYQDPDQFEKDVGDLCASTKRQMSLQLHCLLSILKRDRGLFFPCEDLPRE